MAINTMEQMDLHIDLSASHTRKVSQMEDEWIKTKGHETTKVSEIY